MIGDGFLGPGLLEDAKLDLQRRRAGHGARANAQQDGVERVLLTRSVAECDEPMRQPFERRLRDVRVVVPDDPGTRGGRDGRTQLGMVIAPEHLVVT